MADQIQRSREVSLQAAGNSDFGYNAFPAVSQACSIHSSEQDVSNVQNASVLSFSENANGCSDDKPALPPKPFQGPPTYRDPPSPPVHDENKQHPDICINSTPPHPRSADPISHSSQAANIHERIDRMGSRTHAWVQEHKTSGKLVGEKLSSLQRKLRSLLTQPSPTKESMDAEKKCVSSEKSAADGCSDSIRFHSVSQPSQRHEPYTCVAYSLSTSSSVNESHPSYISSPLFTGSNGSTAVPHPSSHGHPCKTYQAERHPFGAPLNPSEHEDSTNPDQLRDTCTKFFSREQRISWSNYLSPRNCYSNNIKSTYDYDKLVPKEVIGRPSQVKKSDVSSNCEDIYGDVAPFPSFGKVLAAPAKQTEQQSSQALDRPYFARRVQNFSAEVNVSDAQLSDTKPTSKENEETPAENLPHCDADNGDINDLYKSSSESGRGTMHSSMHGCKSVISPHSSGVSAGSNLDTSLDSDHSANGALWEQHNNSEEAKYPGEYQANQSRHIYETPNSSVKCRQSVDKEQQDDISSESLSATPPLPPLSPAPSPPISAENSPKLSSKAKYKLPSSVSAVNGSYMKGNEHQQKFCEMTSTKSVPGKKTGVRRTTSINQATCRYRNGKAYQCTKAPLSCGHRLGISHNSCGSKKCSNSPPSRHHSRNQIAFPCFLDNADPELTSTTTGLDMESLLDEADDYSSDLSVTTSTMEPNEVNMIRKQLEGLETMYSEILRLLGVKGTCKGFGSALDVSRHSRRRVNGSLSSLTARSSLSRGNHNFGDKRGFSEKRHSKECRSSSAGKRLQRLESHVVTLARSVAHLSSEMRTQHILVQELENIRQDVSWVQERLRLMQLTQGCHSGNNAAKSRQLAMPRDWDNFHQEVLELLNPCRAKKLTKFFGDEPPLIRQFLKRLGYEKYATNFENEKIGIKELPYLTEERLQKMGIPMGPCIRILQEAHACCQQNQYKVYIV